MTLPPIWKRWAIRPGSRSIARWSVPATPACRSGACRSKLKIAPSTLSHHIKALVVVGLVNQVREATTLVCHANYEVMRGLVGFPGRRMLRRRIREQGREDRGVSFSVHNFDISSLMGEGHERDEDGRDHRRRSGRSCRRRACAGARPDADRAGGGPRSRPRRARSGATCNYSRRGNTTSTAPPSGCSRRPAGIRPIRSRIRPAPNWWSAISSRWPAGPPSRQHIRTRSRVTAIGRAGFDKVKSKGREAAPFEIRYQNGKGPKVVSADAVIDASGTWHSPNPAGANGLPAIGERRPPERIAYGMPDVLGRDRARYAGKTVAVLGAGHSAIGTLTDLAQLAEQAPGTKRDLAVARQRSRQGFWRRRERQACRPRRTGRRISPRWSRRAASRLETGFRGFRIVAEPTAPRCIVGARTAAAVVSVAVDELIVATGFRPDLDFVRELRIQLDPAIECPVALAPLIDPNEHSCGTVRPHGARELAQPEPGFYFAGMKSYGRAPTFLMLTGYEQVRSIAADIAGDHEAAARVELVLPETGVCSRAAAPECKSVAAAVRHHRRLTPVAPRMQMQSNRARPDAAAVLSGRRMRREFRSRADRLSSRCAWGRLAACCPTSSCRRSSPRFLIPEWHLSGAQAGLLAGSGAAGYMLAVPVLATLTDRIDARKILIAGSVVSALGTLLFGLFATGLWSGALLQRDRRRRLCRRLYAGPQGADRPACAGGFIPRHHAVHVELLVRRRLVLSGVATGRGRLGLARRLLRHGRRPAGDAGGLLAVAAGRAEARDRAGCWISHRCSRTGRRWDSCSATARIASNSTASEPGSSRSGPSWR